MNIRLAPKLAMHNKATLSLVKECACYYCIKVFQTEEIKEYTDFEQDTAICPYCKTDTVIPVMTPDDKDLMNLQKIKQFWL